MLMQALSLPEAIRGFFAVIADAHLQHRLKLGPHGRTEGPLTVIEPVSGNNITADHTPSHRKRLINACRRALKQFDDMSVAAESGPQRTVESIGKKLFVGSRKG